MKPAIYDQHDAAFAQVQAFVILNYDGERVATVALKFPRDGAGRLYAYVHLIGVEMVRAFAGGYGYDKRSAAVSAAIGKITAPEDTDCASRLTLLRTAATAMEAGDWTREIERAGLRVLQAV